MRPILFHIPVIPLGVWVALLVGFFGLSAYWGYRDVIAAGGTEQERRRRVLGTIAVHAVLLAVGLVLLWRLKAFVNAPLPVRSYGFMLMLAFGAGMLLMQRRVRNTVLRPESVIDLFLGLLLVTLLSARLMYIALNWSTYGGEWREIFRVWEGGLSFHGGLLGGIGWVGYYAYRQKLSIWWMGDMMAPSLALGYAIARIGCFINGCCYGTHTHLPWGVKFLEPASLAGVAAAAEPRHPTQLYAMLANLVIFGILVSMLRRRRYDGQVFSAYLILYCAYRFLIEWVRKGATAEVWKLGMTEGMWASVAIGVAAVVLWAKLEQRGVLSNPTEAAAAPEPHAKAEAHKEPRQAASASVKAKGKARKRK